MISSIKMDFPKLAELSTQLDSQKIEYIFHKFFDDPSYTFEQSIKDPKHWHFPECWLARYYLYFVHNQHAIQGSKILDLGSNMNFYGVWALENGAREIHSVEPDSTRYELGKEYASITGNSKNYKFYNQTINQFMNGYQGESYDAVFFLDVFYFLTNGIDVLEFITKVIKPKWLFFESNVTNDVPGANALGHFSLSRENTNSRDMASFSNNSTESTRLALRPSKNALLSVVDDLRDYSSVCRYDFQDFIGHGESPPRKRGMTEFFLLKRHST